MDSAAVPITENLLSGAGGWQAMKAARDLVKAGRVSGATYEPPLLAGEVREGQKRYRAGLRVRSASDIENICSCRESREWGKVCAHSLAVGLAYLAPDAPPPSTPPNDAPSPAASPLVARDEPGATPVALHFILAPNFRSAWAKGEVMVCVEAEFDGRRVMLDALPRAERFGCDPHDLAAIEGLAESLGVPVAGMNMLPAAAFLQWIPALRGHPRLSFGKSIQARVRDEIYRPRILLRDTILPLDGVNLAADRGAKAAPTLGDGLELTAQRTGDEAFLIAGAKAWSLRAGEFIEIGSDLPPRLTTVLREPLRLPGERADAFLALELPLWRALVEIELPSDLALPAVEEAQPGITLRIDGSLQQLRATLRCRYGDRPPFSPASEPENLFVFRDPLDPSRLRVRNLTAEKEAVTRLERSGFSRSGDGWEMRDARGAVRFFAFDFSALPRAWEISVTPRLEKASSELEPVAPTIEVIRSGEDWFELKYSVATEAGEGIPLAELQRLLRSGQNQTRLKNGKIGVLNPVALEDFEEVLRDVDPRQSQPGVYRLHRIQAGYLTNTAAEIGARLVDAAQTLRGGGADADLQTRLGSLGEQLRDYQLTGVSWLAALAAQNLGGILADEMGLGKTVQTLALLRLHRGRGPALIVCPTSLLSNWQREAERFTPELKLLLVDGTNRAQKIARLAGHDLALTSYGLLRRDLEAYAGLALGTVVLDEAQHIKNPDTQNAQAAFSLNARLRFVLTGTPMENSVRDLWSLMNFVAPGYLGSRSDFRERYEKPLTTNPDPVLQRRLARRLRPFLLRRRKADVARELPEKIEQVIPCALGPAQRATYDAILREIQQGIGSGAASDGATRMKMLTGLLRLRQTCCDLRLMSTGSAGDSPAVSRDSRDASGVGGGSPTTAGEVARAPQAAESHFSAKLDLLDELLEEIIDGGHRVLIFSQFVKMLDLVRERLEASETGHCYLAGRTKKRQEEVDRFQSDETIPVFLISLKAGGVGLNLSAADTVIHFDPWWNAAVEAQATDRAHRIGQKRIVTSYKLIARDTVEEKILNLQTRKRDLASAMLENEEPLMAGLTTEDLAELLAL